MKYPETFGKVLAFSSAFWFNAEDLNAFISHSKVNLKHQKYYFVQGKHEDEDMKNFFRFLFIISCTFLWSQERKSTATENVKIISENFDVPQLKTTRRIWIYLPKDYENSLKKYEVMYLQDAQNLFDDATSYAGEWQVDETLNKIFEKTGKSVIVVGPIS